MKREDLERQAWEQEAAAYERLAAAARLRAQAAAMPSADATPATYFSQRQLPPWAVSVDDYKRVHRALRREGIDGVDKRGKALTMTPTASAIAAQRKGRRAPAPSPTPTSTTSLASAAAELGLVYTPGRVPDGSEHHDHNDHDVARAERGRRAGGPRAA